jgi:hypothetical protein
VLFLNSLESLHGVAVRQLTFHSRIFLNLMGVVNTPPFSVPVPDVLKMGIDSSPERRGAYCAAEPKRPHTTRLGKLAHGFRRLMLCRAGTVVSAAAAREGSVANRCRIASLSRVDISVLVVLCGDPVFLGTAHTRGSSAHLTRLSLFDP